MHMHMAMTSIPEFDEFGIRGSIFGGEGECQAKVRLGKPIGHGRRGVSTGGLLYDNFILCHNSGMKKTSAKRKSQVFTISFPERLAEQVMSVAEEENRNISELFREAFRNYHLERIHRKLEAARAEAASRGPFRYTEEDVERLVHEIRAESFAKRKKTA